MNEIEQAVRFEGIVDGFKAVFFSLETVRMALSIGPRPRKGDLTLDDRLGSDDPEERESGLAARQALDKAHDALLDLAQEFDTHEYECLGYELGFWTNFEWMYSWIQVDAVRVTGQTLLRHNLVSAKMRISKSLSYIKSLASSNPTFH